eukprot:2222873-Amphidinium_carterae.1
MACAPAIGASANPAPYYLLSSTLAGSRKFHTEEFYGVSNSSLICTKDFQSNTATALLIGRPSSNLGLIVGIGGMSPVVCTSMAV